MKQETQNDQATQEPYKWMYAVPAVITCRSKLKGVATTRRFQLYQQLGWGGMAEVYAGRDLDVVGEERLYAIKIAKAKSTDAHGKLSTEALRFMKEASIASALRHPNVVAVHDSLMNDAGQIVIVMELCGGGLTLLDLIDGQLRNMPIGQRRNSATGKFEDAPIIKRSLSDLRTVVLPLFEQILEGVGACHEQGAIHRDLKPQNVLIIKVNGVRVVKVSDFGIAKSFNDSARLNHGATLTGTGTVIGTPLYMAPEQLMRREGEELGPPADVWALGCILYEMISGRRPFDRISEAAKIENTALHWRIINDPPFPLSSFVVTPDAEIERLIHHALEKNPIKRIQNTDEFRELLHQAVNEVEARLQRKAKGSIPPPAQTEPTPEPQPQPEPQEEAAEPAQFVAEEGSALDDSPNDMANRVTAPPAVARRSGQPLVLAVVVLLALIGVGVWLASRSSATADVSQAPQPVVSVSTPRIVGTAGGLHSSQTAIRTPMPTVSVTAKPKAQDAPTSGQAAKDWKKAEEYFKSGNTQLAITFAELVLSDPSCKNFPEPYRLIGDVKRKLGEDTEACKVFKTYLEFDGVKLSSSNQAFVDTKCSSKP